MTVGEASGKGAESAADDVTGNEQERRANGIEVLDPLEVHQEQEEDSKIGEALEHGREKRWGDRRDLEEAEVE